MRELEKIKRERAEQREKEVSHESTPLYLLGLTRGIRNEKKLLLNRSSENMTLHSGIPC
jgi:hypothetical protein